jgi:hypothetical protein
MQPDLWNDNEFNPETYYTQWDDECQGLEEEQRYRRKRVEPEFLNFDALYMSREYYKDSFQLPLTTIIVVRLGGD